MKSDCKYSFTGPPLYESITETVNPNVLLRVLSCPTHNGTFDLPGWYDTLSGYRIQYAALKSVKFTVRP